MRVKKKHQLGEYQLIQYQIHQSNIIRIVWQAVKRITNKFQWMTEHYYCKEKWNADHPLGLKG